MYLLCTFIIRKFSAWTSRTHVASTYNLSHYAPVILLFQAAGTPRNVPMPGFTTSADTSEHSRAARQQFVWCGRAGTEVRIHIHTQQQHRARSLAVGMSVGLSCGRVSIITESHLVCVCASITHERARTRSIARPFTGSDRVNEITATTTTTIPHPAAPLHLPAHHSS